MASALKIPTSIVQLISAEQAFNYRIVPIDTGENTIYFKTDSNDIAKLQQELTIVLGSAVHLSLLEANELDELLGRHYRKGSSNSAELHYSDDFLIKILSEAKYIGSSDIHFEVFEFKSRIRFRIDGKLIEKFVIPNTEYPVIVNRLKIMSGMDISEKRLPQDGRISLDLSGESIDIRVSALPTLHGEKIVLRLLAKEATNIQLEALGFSKSELELYRTGVQKPNGLILISGPTGSGKTTTLYATLKELNTHDTNILTIEDPIEYTLEGVNQVQLKEAIGLTFGSTLRTFLRQDPDIIMVGEIRDQETAQMAIRAALTGHLVLSTVHTNSAWATVSRLIDMGIPPFLVASTLNLSVAQRLVRKLCPNCKSEKPMSPQLLPNNMNFPEDTKSHYIAKGCDKCYYTGYQGRKAIYEIVYIDAEIEKAIKNNASIEEESIKKKIPTLKRNAIQMVIDGETSIEEVYALLIE